MRNLKRVASTFQEPTVDSKNLGKMWVIFIDKAKDIIRKTSQNIVHDVIKPFIILFKTRQSLFRRRHSQGIASTDTIFPSVKYVRGNKSF